MFESPFTQPHRLQEHHRRVQERSATITPKASEFSQGVLNI